MSLEKEQILEDDEIDVSMLFHELKRFIIVIILCGLLGGVGGFVYSRFFITPLYTASSNMLVLTKETTLASLADLQIGTSLTSDYMELILSRPVMEAVIEELGIEEEYPTAESLMSSISVTNPEDTRILEIYVTNSDSAMALAIVQAVANESSEYIGDMMEVIPPKIIDEGVLPTTKSSPSYSTYTIIGALVGLLLSAGIVIVRAILDDTIKNEEDIEKYLGIPTLSVVPDRKDFIGDSKGSKKKKKNKKKKVSSRSINKMMSGGGE